MVNLDISAALALLEEEGLRLPHGLPPGSYPGGCDQRFTAATWAEYAWETVGGRFPRISAADQAASAKPSWAVVTAAARRASLEGARSAAAERLRVECRSRITSAYGETSWHDEIEARLRGGSTPQQDAERDRLRGRYKALTKTLGAMTSAQLRAFDATDDTYWGESS